MNLATITTIININKMTRIIRIKYAQQQRIKISNNNNPNNRLKKIQ